MDGWVFVAKVYAKIFDILTCPFYSKRGVPSSLPTTCPESLSLLVVYLGAGSILIVWQLFDYFFEASILLDDDCSVVHVVRADKFLLANFKAYDVGIVS